MYPLEFDSEMVMRVCLDKGSYCTFAVRIRDGYGSIPLFFYISSLGGSFSGSGFAWMSACLTESHGNGNSCNQVGRALGSEPQLIGAALRSPDPPAVFA